MAGDAAGAASDGDRPSVGTIGSRHKKRASTHQELSFEDMMQKALRNRMKTACTSYNAESDAYEWKSLRTPPVELGVYGVGNQLYFEFMFYVGVLFSVLFVLSLPSLICALMGSFVADVQETHDANFFFKLLSKLTLANLGACADCIDYADFRERSLSAGSETRVSDVTPWLGNLDALSQLLVLVFCAWMLMYMIPRTETTQDELFTTAADFAVKVSNLPRRLPKEHHHGYKAQLTDHLQNALVALGEDQDEARPVEVHLVREFEGALYSFNAQGLALKELENHELNMQHHREKAEICENEKDKKAHAKHVARWTKKHERTHKKIMGIEDKLAQHNELHEKDRFVCGAYVMFKHEAVKDKILKAYSARSVVSQATQPHYLRFHGRRIRVEQACEPSDLIHENLDYHYMRRGCNRCMVNLVAVMVVVCNLLVLVYLRSVEKPPDTNVQNADMWVVRPAAGNTTCWSLCNWGMYADLSCNGSAPLPTAAWYDDRNVTDLSGGNCWTSPACNATAGPTQNYFAAELRSPSSVSCMSLPATVQDAPTGTLFDIWSCHKSEAGGLRPGGGGADARLEDTCVQYASSTSGEAWVTADAHCVFPVTYASARLAKDSGKEQNKQRIRCFCVQQSLKGSTFLAPPYDTPEKDLCKEWIHEQWTKNGYMLLGIVLVIVVNLLIYVVFMILNAYIRFEQATHYAAHELICLFWPKFFNTGLSVLIVSMNFHGAFNNVGLGWTQLGSGPYDDVSPGWFVIVGTSLVVGFIGQAACALCCPMFYNWILNPFLIWLSKDATRSQAMLNDLYELPEWAMNCSLAEGMVVIFCCLVYGGGMPLCYLLGALYCVGTYWVEKYTLLRHSRKPREYNSTTIRKATCLLPIAVFGHLFVSMYFYGNQNLLPSPWGPLLGLCEWKFGITRAQYEETIEDFSFAGTDARKIMYPDYANARSLDTARTSCFGLYLVLFALLLYVAFVILRFLFPPCCKPINRALGSAGEWIVAKTGVDFKADQNKLSYAEAKEAATSAGHVFSYNITENPDYAEACAALNFDGDGDPVPKPYEHKRDIDDRLQDMEKGFLDRLEKLLGAAGLTASSKKADNAAAQTLGAAATQFNDGAPISV